MAAPHSWLAHLPVPPLLSCLTTCRTLKRKSSSVKRLSPAPQLGPSSDTHTSYYSESLVRESYFGSPRAASLARSSILDDQLHGDPYWSECPEPFSWGSATSGHLRSQMCVLRHHPPHAPSLYTSSPLTLPCWFPNHCGARGRALCPWKNSQVSELPGDKVATKLLQSQETEGRGPAHPPGPGEMGRGQGQFHLSIRIAP